MFLTCLKAGIEWANKKTEKKHDYNSDRWLKGWSFNRNNLS